MARAITIVIVALSVSIPAFGTILLTEANQASSESGETNDDGDGDDKSLLPFPENPTRRRKQRNANKNNSKNKNKQVLSLFWRDGDLSPIPFPTKAIKPNTNSNTNNSNLWSVFWGGLMNNNSNKQKEDEFRKDQEQIRRTLRKFYRLADPKFARASLATARKSSSMRLPGSSDTIDDKQLESMLEEDGDDLLPGTILEMYTKPDIDIDSEPGVDNIDEETPARLEDYAYELVDRIQQELGATPQHYMDFAYRSVTASSTPISNGGSSSSKRRTPNAGDDLLIDGGTADENQPTCKVVVSTPDDSSSETSFVDKSEDVGDCRNDSDSDSDRAMAFFASWWKWWLPFASSQWWKDNGSSKADYDIGKTPFAGGSNGEVWKGRRICHRNKRSSSRDFQTSNHRAFVNSRLQKEIPEQYYFSDDDDNNFENDWDGEEDFHRFDEFEHGRNGHANGDDDHDDECDDQTPLVLKRLKVERGYLLLEAGLREVYFGKLIARVLEDTKHDMYTVYVDHFFREVPRRHQPRSRFGGLPNTGSHRANDLELWIVYEDAGPSLRSYIYSPIESDGGFVMHQHSKLWTKLRTFSGEDEEDINFDDESSVEVLPSDKPNGFRHKKKETSSSNETKNKGKQLGRMFLQKTLREILAAAAELHKRGIVHRDIKPSNVMCQSDRILSLEELFESEKHLSSIVCKLGDFSSGWDRYTSEHLYTKGPTPGEQTDEYAPPESYVGPYWKPFDEEKPQSYDSWSIGVLALELLLGTPHVFSVDQRTNVLLTAKLKRARASEEEIAYAMYLAALSNFCIFVPSNETSSGAYSWPLRYGDPLHKVRIF